MEGLTKAQVEKNESAISLYEKALKQAPHQPAILDAMAAAYQNTGDLESALLYARQAARQAPDRPRYGRRAATLLAKLDRPQEALATYRRLLEKAPHNQPTLQALAHHYADQGEAASALRTYIRFLQAGTDSILVRRRIAPLVRRSQKAHSLPSALRDTLANLHLLPSASRKKTATKQDDVQSLVARARKLTTSNPQRARRLLRQVLDRKANHAEALSLLGTLLFNYQEYPEAADVLRRAVQQNPRDSALWRRAGFSLLRTNQFAEAQHISDNGLLLFPGSLPLLQASARAALRVDEPTAAFDRTKEALNLLKKDPDATAAERATFLLLRGDALAQQDHRQAARRDWKKARRLNPENTAAEKRLRE